MTIDGVAHECRRFHPKIRVIWGPWINTRPRQRTIKRHCNQEGSNLRRDGGSGAKTLIGSMHLHEQSSPHPYEVAGA
jgi:hypothetical protein